MGFSRLLQQGGEPLGAKQKEIRRQRVSLLDSPRGGDIAAGFTVNNKGIKGCAYRQHCKVHPLHWEADSQHDFL